ncbi:MAG: hypothetical protein E6R04_04390 [Spirochaetes bacterium]|jgi:hypothetical protein|nr:MAG: hypothetical protein E6R04_04390 [Spirochaetota bacterium]
MTDDELGKTFLYHSNPNMRDQEIWRELSRIENTERARKALINMKGVNDLALLTRREGLHEVKRKALLDGGCLSQNPEWLNAKTEFDSWHERSKRFNLRVRMALDAIRDIHQDAGYESPSRHVRYLVNLVNNFVHGNLDQDTLVAKVKEVSDMYEGLSA